MSKKKKHKEPEVNYDALKALGNITNGSCNAWLLAGHANRFVRQELMQQLTGVATPVAECGVNNLMAKFCEVYKVPQTHDAGSIMELRYMFLRLSEQTADSCRTIAVQGALLVRLQGHGLCKVWSMGLNHGQIVYGKYNTEKIAPWDVIAEAINANAELGL